MTISKAALATAAIAMLATAGCQSSRISTIDTTGPAPVAAAPAGTVVQSQLPAPTAPAPVTATANSSQFPAAPAAPATPAAGAAPAASTANVDVASAGAADITVGSVAGVWNVSLNGQSCKVATPQTKYGQGFRAGPLHCPGDMANVKSWSVAGKQLVFYDENGGTLARLYQSSAGKFDGQTTGGSAVSLTR